MPLSVKFVIYFTPLKYLRIGKGITTLLNLSTWDDTRNQEFGKNANAEPAKVAEVIIIYQRNEIQ